MLMMMMMVMMVMMMVMMMLTMIMATTIMMVVSVVVVITMTATMATLESVQHCLALVEKAHSRLPLSKHGLYDFALLARESQVAQPFAAVRCAAAHRVLALAALALHKVHGLLMAT
jgi:hypothetical protein